jgi:glyoxylase-like metal-dependent hydrolase (beta-lactamase superfamily II)
VPRIRDSVTQLGFKLTDIKIILNSHAHTDHAGGHAAMQKLTGAKILMSRRRHPDGFLAKRRRTGVAPVSIFPD